MRDHEAVFDGNAVTGVYCFSGSGHSMAVARLFAEELSAPLYDISAADTPCAADIAVVVFPVYSQAVPKPVRDFLPQLRSTYAVTVATYGRMGYGNVLQEAAALLPCPVIAAACIPTGHSYLDEIVPLDTAQLQPLFHRLRAPRPVLVPKRRKSLLAHVFPEIRSRIGVTIRKGDACSHCGLCSTLCPIKTMDAGQPGRNCIRCLRCVANCPEQALSFRCHPFLRWYLRRVKCEEYFLVL